MNNNENYISSYCCIKPNNVLVNGINVFNAPENINAIDFIKSVYKKFEINYPKFYKMDSLCKLGFVASELLLKDQNLLSKYNSSEIAVVIANRSSSLDIDIVHQQSIDDDKNYFPSPANFVYTLPNILIGEIAIRNKIKGENTFFIFDKFDTSFMSKYIAMLLNNDKAKVCIAGWVDFYEDKFEAYLYLVEKTKQGTMLKHNEQELNKLITINTN